jgi:hypothetical protein
MEDNSKLKSGTVSNGMKKQTDVERRRIEVVRKENIKKATRKGK